MCRTTDYPIARRSSIRWIIYIGIAVFAGGLLFELLIATRVSPASEDDHQSLSFALIASNRFTSIALIAIIVVILAQIAQLILQTTIAFDVIGCRHQANQLIDLVTQSDWGRFWSWRFTAAILAAIALFAALQSTRAEAQNPRP